MHHPWGKMHYRNSWSVEMPQPPDTKPLGFVQARWYNMHSTVPPRFIWKNEILLLLLWEQLLWSTFVRHSAETSRKSPVTMTLAKFKNPKMPFSSMLKSLQSPALQDTTRHDWGDLRWIEIRRLWHQHGRLIVLQNTRGRNVHKQMRRERTTQFVWHIFFQCLLIPNE